MTPRQRYTETLTFSNPDKIPFAPGGPRESTLAVWRRQGLPQEVSWQSHLLEILQIEPEKAGPPVDLGVEFRMIPQFEEKVLDHKNGHYVVQDWKGNICEISDEFDVSYLRHAKDFVTRRWLRCPVENREDFERIKQRYRLDSPGRFGEGFAGRCQQAHDRDWLLQISFPGPFWQMREWCGFESLCMMMIDEPELVADMAEFWSGFVADMLREILAHITPDAVQISEDMAYKAKAMISPAMTRRFCRPSWTRWTKQLRDAGCRLIDMDSDGFIGELIPIWMESGITVCDPIEVAAHNDINDFRRRFGCRMAYRQGIDKRAIAKGGPTMRDELKRIEPVVKEGGYIPGCDHGVPPDISWQNFVDYSRLLARMTGWR